MSIRINDLTVRFKNGVVAVNKASLEIPKGIYGLLGENGAGKTTLMRVLTTVLKQTEGMVSLDGKNTEKDWLSSTGNRLISESYGERMSCIYGGTVRSSQK